MRGVLGFAVVWMGHAFGTSAEPFMIDTHTHFKGKEQVAHEATQREYDPRNTLGHVVVPEDYRELADRAAGQTPFKRQVPLAGAMQKYADQVGSAHLGAVTHDGNLQWPMEDPQ